MLVRADANAFAKVFGNHVVVPACHEQQLCLLCRTLMRAMMLEANWWMHRNG